jgi:hypothetical protein
MLVNPHHASACQGTPTGSAYRMWDDSVRKRHGCHYELPLYATCRPPRVFDPRSVTHRLRWKRIARLIEYPADGRGRTENLGATCKSIGDRGPDCQLQCHRHGYHAFAISMESKRNRGQRSDGRDLHDGGNHQR